MDSPFDFGNILLFWKYLDLSRTIVHDFDGLYKDMG